MSLSDHRVIFEKNGCRFTANIKENSTFIPRSFCEVRFQKNEDKSVNFDDTFKIIEKISLEKVRSISVNPFRTTLREKWGNFIFRRVYSAKCNICSSVHISGNECDNAQCNLYNHEGTCIQSEPYMDRLEANNDVKDRLAEVVCNDFSGSTTRSPLRKNDKHKGILLFNSDNYYEVDLTDTLSCDITLTRKSILLPKKDGLICGLVGDNNEYTKWFNCSEQFYKLWTIIMCNDPKICFPKNNHQHQIVNRLKCNKVKLWAETEGKDKDEHTKSKRAYIIRTELSSGCSYYSLYQLLALKVVYQNEMKLCMEEFPGEFPLSRNGLEYLAKVWYNIGGWALQC